MSIQHRKNESIEKHIRIHSERSQEDIAAVTTVKDFFKYCGKIMPNFSENDKWPNTDGTFEFISNPDITRRPEQSFFVQIKGTKNYKEENGLIKYSLQSLAFPAFIFRGVTLDPGILFVVLNSKQRGQERIFWKYMSVDFLNSIDYEKDSVTIRFKAEEEITNSDEGIEDFCEKLKRIVKYHTFVSKLDEDERSMDDIKRIIDVSSEQISECIDRLDFFDETREDVSRRMLNRLYDLCVATLLLNTVSMGYENANLRLAWEKSMLNIETKYLGAFLRSLKYVGNRIPEEGQSERLMLKYYDFLWQIRKYLYQKHGISVLQNLEKFPLNIDNIDMQYYSSIAFAIENTNLESRGLCESKYYVQKITPFYVAGERYFEVTLQLAGRYASKYNRITAYTKENISTNYSVRIDYVDINIDLWEVGSKIKVITNWSVAIEPRCLNRLAKILGMSTKISGRQGEYIALMDFLTKTGLSFLDLIDLKEVAFQSLVESIYYSTNTKVFKDVLYELREKYSADSCQKGRNIVRFLLINLRSDTIESVLPTSFHSKRLCDDLYISSLCYPFEKNPFISNLTGSKTTENQSATHVAAAVGFERMKCAYPYLVIKSETKKTREIYFDKDSRVNTESIKKFNDSLDEWERRKGHMIKEENQYVFIEHYEKRTLDILRELINRSQKGNKGQEQFNRKYLKQKNTDGWDPLKVRALYNVFVNSQILLIYGAAGTGKTTLINHISNLMSGHKKLFLTKTHTALQNLRRRIDNPGSEAEFISLNSFNKKVIPQDYDIIFVDECSIIDNRTMSEFLKKVGPDTFIVLAGDIHQIESIEFGNWFYYAKEIIKRPGASVELLSTWRTEDEDLINLWNEVRTTDGLITEKLALTGPYSENIGPNLLQQSEADEVVLCLNYDGKFGLNNINRFFQNANPNPAISWYEWIYKVGDRILFNETPRFSLLYNNLKGTIVEIEEKHDLISFTVDVETVLTEKDCRRDGIEFIEVRGKYTRIRFSVFQYSEGDTEEELQIKSVVPFQLAYAVSIHKAQGLEYDSVKIVIPNNNAERISHGIFYTAITRAKKRLKIYWSAETMDKVIKEFYKEEKDNKSLDIIKKKLG